MDTYKEQNVKKAVTTNDTIRKFSLILSAISLSGVLLLLSMMYFQQGFLLAIFLSGLMIYGAFYFLKDLQVEYEYLYTNGDLDVDKIMGQRKRKRLVTVEMLKVTKLEKYTDDVEFDDEKTVVDASSNYDEQHWYMEFSSKKYGECYLVFTPNDEMLDVIIHGLPRIVRDNVKR